MYMTLFLKGDKHQRLIDVLGSCLLLSSITLPESNTPENGWLEDDCFRLGPGKFSGTVIDLQGVL